MSRVRKRKMARPKKENAMTRSKTMNQVRCQKGRSRSESENWLRASLYTIRVRPEITVGFAEAEDEACFLRERPCGCCWPDGATAGEGCGRSLRLERERVDLVCERLGFSSKSLANFESLVKKVRGEKCGST